MGFPGGSDNEESACSARDPGSTPGPGRSPGEGNSNPLQCSCQENLVGRGARRAAVHWVTESDLTKRLRHTHTHTHKHPGNEYTFSDPQTKSAPCSTSNLNSKDLFHFSTDHSLNCVDLSYLLPTQLPTGDLRLNIPRMHASMLSSFSRVRLCATPMTAAHQAPLSLGFSRQEYWSGLP